MKKGRAATMTHDYKRNGTTTLFAALNVKTGGVIGECLPRHRAKEFIRFLKKIDRTVAKHLDLHLIADNYTTHKTKEVQAWLAERTAFPRRWLNLVERFFAEITGKRIRGVSSQAWPNWRLPSMTILPSTMPDPNHSYGRKPLMSYSKRTPEPVPISMQKSGTKR